jgi:hypothetical protein
MPIRIDSNHQLGLAPIQENSMRIIFRVAIGALISAAPCVSGAQVPTHAGDTALSTGDMQSLIKAFAGSWSLKTKFEPSREMPSGFEGTGEETWHAGPQGLTFTDEEVFTVGPQTGIVVGIFWRDPKTKAFHSLDCSNEISHVCDLKGALEDVVVHWTGSELTVDEKEISGGTMMTSRVAWSEITPNSFTESGYLAPAGGPFRKVMTVHATRSPAQ